MRPVDMHIEYISKYTSTHCLHPSSEPTHFMTKGLEELFGSAHALLRQLWILQLVPEAHSRAVIRDPQLCPSSLSDGLKKARFSMLSLKKSSCRR